VNIISRIWISSKTYCMDFFHILFSYLLIMILLIALNIKNFLISCSQL